MSGARAEAAPNRAAACQHHPTPLHVFARRIVLGPKLCTDRMKLMRGTIVFVDFSGLLTAAARAKTPSHRPLLRRFAPAAQGTGRVFQRLCMAGITGTRVN